MDMHSRFAMVLKSHIYDDEEIGERKKDLIFKQKERTICTHILHTMGCGQR